ncbi:1-acyl-sn-glycerol-3-phosphate acyltransferase [Alloprevotella sp. OH1205_COT-284]|uniref:lysophospholipid acyltransferase family protein n=1 Tax=Alloprevotella sp. OH1205_COT-284 TaxID=2491043 RepID=UPI000F5E748E|nr:lysophospholipid acyltransferase family protein [Alloprevotella sp. OH1205_COT-284]RRD80063.1 1-acyl-sn-glycerol-3-phosphate acyltransferase [Alloprevotella sp. OH1205_COT-284]
MKLFYRIYQFFVVAPFFILTTFLTAFFTALGCSIGLSRWFSFMPSRLWGIGLIRMLFLPVRVEGREHLQKGQSYVFVANHQGAFDIYFLSGFLGRDFKWMMKKSLRKIPFVGFACEKAGFIFVDKSNRHAIAETMNIARKRLQGGTSLMVFPEGARTFDGRMVAFKRGAFQLADELQLPVVPITIDGCFDVLPRTRGFGFVDWHPLRLVIHPPIAPKGQGGDNVKTTLEESRRAIMSALPERYRDELPSDER